VWPFGWFGVIRMNRFVSPPEAVEFEDEPDTGLEAFVAQNVATPSLDRFVEASLASQGVVDGSGDQ